MESEGLRFELSWRIRIFSLSPARHKTKHIFLKMIPVAMDLYSYF